MRLELNLDACGSGVCRKRGVPLTEEEEEDECPKRRPRSNQEPPPSQPTGEDEMDVVSVTSDMLVDDQAGDDDAMETGGDGEEDEGGAETEEDRDFVTDEVEEGDEEARDRLHVQLALGTGGAEKKGPRYLMEYCNPARLKRIVSQLPTVMAGVADDKKKVVKASLLNYKRGVDGEGCLVVMYERSDHGIGRWYAKKAGQQHMTRAIRHDIADDMYYDVDVVGCHPTLLYQLCVQHGIQDQVPWLRDLVEKRATVVAWIQEQFNVDYEGTKDKLMLVMNGRPGKCHKKLKPLSAEMGKIYELAKRHFPDIVAAGEASARAKKPEDPNLQGSTIALLAQHLEALVMEAAVDYLKRMGVIVPVEATLRNGTKVMCDGQYVDAYDGVQLIKDHVHRVYPPSTVESVLLREMERAVLDKTGYRVVFKIKPMDLRIEGLPELDVADEIDLEQHDELLRIFSHYEVAQYIKTVPAIKDKVRYNDKGPVWYQLNEERWVATKEPIFLPPLMMDAVKPILNQAIEEAEDKKKKQALLRHLTNIGNTSFQGSVIKQLQRDFRDTNFGGRLDSRRDLLVFNDAVYNMETKEWGPLKAEYLISESFGTGYARPTSKPHIRAGLERLLEDMFISKPTADYVLDILASLPYGVNGAQEIYIFVGGGGNGKTLLMKLVQKALGIYCQYLKTEAVTKKARGPNDHDDWSKTRGARCIVLEEPEQGDVIQAGMWKKISGGAAITARDPNHGTITFHPQFIVILLCNLMPLLTTVDRGTRRRTRAVPFDVTFLKADEVTEWEDPETKTRPKGYPANKLADLSWETKADDPDYHQEFMLMLLERHAEKDFVSNPVIAQPPAVRLATQEYLNNSDPVGQVSEILETFFDVTHDEDDWVYASDISGAYREHRKKIISGQELRRIMEEKLGYTYKNDSRGSVYLGIKSRGGMSSASIQDKLKNIYLNITELEMDIKRGVVKWSIRSQLECIEKKIENLGAPDDVDLNRQRRVARSLCEFIRKSLGDGDEDSRIPMSSS